MSEVSGQHVSELNFTDDRSGVLLKHLSKQAYWESIKITTQRIVLAKGVFRQDVEEVEFYRVTDIQSYQGTLDRLTGIGIMTLLSDDTTAPTLRFRIHSPGHYREIIRECVNRERKRMRTVQFD